jgi:hypothetical protein
MALVNSTDSMTDGRTQARGRWYRQLYVWVLIGMVLGAATGLIAPKFGKSLEILGDSFVSLLTMLLGHGALRSHGGRHEQPVPLITSRPVTGPMAQRYHANVLRSRDIHDLVLNNTDPADGAD